MSNKGTVFRLSKSSKRALAAVIDPVRRNQLRRMLVAAERVAAAPVRVRRDTPAD